VWDPATGKELAALRGHMGPIRRLFLTADGKSIVSGGFDGTVRFWSSDSLKEERQIMTFAEGVGCADVSPDGKWLVAGTRPSYPPDPAVIKVWDVATGKEKASIKGTTRKIASLAVSPDGASLAMGGGFWNELGEIKIFDLATGRERATFIDHKDMVACVAFSLDGQWLVSAGGGQRTLGEVRIWDAKRLVAKGE
jgi:WD40 repeat protein